jgi:hypothetical protein
MVQGKRATSERELSGEKKTPSALVWISLFLFFGFSSYIRVQSVCLARSHKLTYIGLYISLSLFLRARPLLNNDQTRIARRVRKTNHSQFRYIISGMPIFFSDLFSFAQLIGPSNRFRFISMQVRSRESNGQSNASRAHCHKRDTQVGWCLTSV